MFTIELQEIAHVHQHSNAHISDVLHLLETSYYTLLDAISQALEIESSLTGMVCDNEWTEFEITVYPSGNTAIMPHMVEIDGTIYNADYAVRVLACYMSSYDHMQLRNRVVSLSEVS